MSDWLVNPCTLVTPPSTLHPSLSWPAVTPALEPFSHLQLAPPAADCDITATRHREKLAEADWQSTHVTEEGLAEADWQSADVRREGMCWAQPFMAATHTARSHSSISWLIATTARLPQPHSQTHYHSHTHSNTATATLPQPDCHSQTTTAILNLTPSQIQQDSPGQLADVKCRHPVQSWTPLTWATWEGCLAPCYLWGNLCQWHHYLSWPLHRLASTALLHWRGPAAL